jgi:hypothetical protein
MPHLVRGQLRQLQRVAQAVENVFHRPFANGLARIALRVREKNGASRVTTVAVEQGSARSLDRLFETAPSRMREDDGAG